MPASTCEPVNAALRQALSNERGPCGSSSGDLDSRLIVSAKRVLNTQIEFEQAESYKSTVLDNLKNKYIVLSSSSSKTIQMTPEADKDEDILPEPKQVLFPPEAVQLGWQESGWHTGVGMLNTGNTCYLNSTLQALFHVPALINWLVSDRDHRSNCEGCMVCAVAKTLMASQAQSQQPIRPWMVSSKLRVVCRHLVPGRQEDAHEFLRYLVEAMERAYITRFNIENLDARSKETTPLNQILGGYLRSAVRCLQCGHVSTTVQHFQDLLLDVRKAGTVDDALTSYFACERLDDLAYRCESCRRKVSAVKQFSLEQAPCVLCIQLKRFAGAGGKITKHIAFRQRLDLTRFSHRKPAAPLVYKLVALVTHMGMSANCGHYTAIGLTPSGTYYEFDDCSVRHVSQQVVFNTNAYIMFYELEHDGAKISMDKFNGKTNMKAKPSGIANSTKLSKSLIQTSSSMQSMSMTVTSASNNSKPKLLLSSFKSYMIPTPVRSKNLLAENQNEHNVSKKNNEKITNGKGNASPLKLGPFSTAAKTAYEVDTKPVNQHDLHAETNGGHTENFCKINGNSENHTDKYRNDISRLLDSPEPEIKQNGFFFTPTKSTGSNEQKTSQAFLSMSQNGANETNGVSINGTTKRRLVPYESDGSSSESEEAPSGKWLISARTESRAPSLNGDTSWHNRNKEPPTKNENIENNDNTTKTVSQLMRMSHSGYGASVVSWTGGRSVLEKEVASERREQFKRHRADVDELDRGRVKKRRQNGVPRSNPGYNPFQEYQTNRRWQNTNGNGTFHKHFYNTPNQRYRRRFFQNNKHNRFHR